MLLSYFFCFCSLILIYFCVHIPFHGIFYRKHIAIKGFFFTHYLTILYCIHITCVLIINLYYTSKINIIHSFIHKPFEMIALREHQF